MVQHARGRHRSEKDSWNSLRLFQFYRLGFTLVLLFIYFLNSAGTNLGSRSGGLFLAACLVSLLVNTGLVFLSFYPHLSSFRQQVFNILAVDIVFLMLLMQASGGLGSGLGLILIISVAGCSLLLPGRKAIFFAAVTTLSLFVSEIFSWLYQFQPYAKFEQVALHGAVLFTIAILSAHLARRASSSEALANQQAEDLASLAALNEHIVDKLEAGVLVVGNDQRVRLMNQAAGDLLQSQRLSNRTDLNQLSPALQKLWQQWAAKPELRTYPLHIPDTGNDLDCRFVHIGTGDQVASLIFLDDVSRQRQQMQEMKLASLGRLTASIAHEIRNPLGSISHAAQLLAESESLEASDRRLIDIVNGNAQRMNILIEDVLNLSRRPSSNRVNVELSQWLRELVMEYLEQQPSHIDVELYLDRQEANIDTHQLHQVLWNLLSNACRYAKPLNAPLKLVVRLNEPASGFTRIDIIDNGEPITDATRRHLFEPFFTTGAQGTGLGLFISRELCQSHGGALSFISAAEGGNCFRVQLPTAL